MDWTAFSVIGTLLVSSVGIFVGIHKNNNQKKIDIITKERTVKYNNLRKIFGLFFGHINCALFSQVDDHIFELILLDLGNIRAQFGYGFEEDKMIIDLSKELVEMLSLYKNREISKEEVIKAYENIVHLVDVYINTEWKRIKVETSPDKNADKNHKDWQENFKNYMNYNKNARKAKKVSYLDK